MIQLNSTIRNDIKAGVQNFEYLINIDNQVYVATRKQMLITDTNEDLYFEDAGMRISDLSEKIDLKTKKPQLGNTTITFANFTVYKGGKEKKFSDEFQLVGKEIKIYFKTQSCKTLAECLLVAQLKITRIKHDDKKITISANDLSIDSTYKEIPDNDYVLLKDKNTFDYYSLKPVPTLYGHLENAPAIVYKEEIIDDFQVKLIPDTSYFDEGEIGGIAKFDNNGKEGIVFSDSDGDYGNTIYNDKIELTRQNVVKIGIGDHICDVPCLPFKQTRDGIVNPESNELDVEDFEGNKLKPITHTESQWKSYNDHILFNTFSSIGINREENIETSRLWCSINEKPTKQESLSYHIKSTGATFGAVHFYGSQVEHTLNELNSMFLESGWSPISDSYNERYTIGVQKFNFKSLNGVDLNDNDSEIVRSDVNFVGSVTINNEHFDTFLASAHYFTQFYSVFSSPIHNTEGVGIQNQNTLLYDGDFTDRGGYPSSITDNLGNMVFDLALFDQHKIGRSIFNVQGRISAGVDIWQNNITSFKQENDIDINNFKSIYSPDSEGIYPIIDANTLSIYYLANDLDTGTSQPRARLTINSMWRDVELRKYWYNKNVLEKDFFVNAKGKLGDVEPNLKKIQGNIVVKHEGTEVINDIGVNNQSNIHFTELYKFLTNSDYKTKTIDGEVYFLMLASYNQTEDKYNFIYDIEVENMKYVEEDLPDNIYSPTNILYPSGDLIQHQTGWILKFNATYFGDELALVGSDFGRGSNGVRLVYGKKIYENTFVSNIEFVEDEVFKDFNDNNYYEFPFEGQVFSSDYELGYTSVFWNMAKTTLCKKLIEKPHEILQHLLSGENSDFGFDNNKINTIYNKMPEYKLALSINKKINTSEIIQKICQQSPIYYRYRGRDKKIVVDFFKNEYDDSDLSGVIETQRLLKFSFDKTKIEDSCMGGVVVNYGYNYSTEKFDKRTGKRDTGLFRTDYAEYYGIDELKGYEVEIDAPYIQDKSTAEYYRDYYFELNKQQKLTCKFELSMSDGIQYEVGDIIRFDANPNNTQPYGIDLTTNNQIIDQESTPYFFITKVQKSLFRVKIECVQTHNLKYDFPQVSLLGDINLDGQVTTTGDNSDLFLLLDMVGIPAQDKNYEQLQEEGWTLQQIINADMNQDGIVGFQDIILFTQEFSGTV